MSTTIRKKAIPNLYKKQCIIHSGKTLIFLDSFKQTHFIKYHIKNSEMKIFEDNETNRKEEISKELSTSSKRMEFDMLFGFIELFNQKYAIFVTESEFVGFLMLKQSIWQAKKFVFEPIGPSSKGTMSLSHSQGNPDENYIYLLKKLLNTNSFYFSHYYDLTNTMQYFISENNLKPNSRFFINECNTQYSLYINKYRLKLGQLICLIFL